MTTQSSTRVALPGKCHFCQSEVDKRQMTQHLKRCKQRATDSAAEKETRAKKKTKLFHLLVEGTYNPYYWMHLEVPASEPLQTLDTFLRDIWVECCGHLSAFRIDGTNYQNDMSDDMFFIGGPGSEVDAEEEENEGDGEINGEILLQDMPESFQEILPSSWLDELKVLKTADAIVAFAQEKLRSTPEPSYPRAPEEIEVYQKNHRQRAFLRDLIEDLQDTSLDVPLAKVLSVGKKFSYEYDFGSTTYLSLKVVAEREGIVPNKRKPVVVMARNLPPAIACEECGKSATMIDTEGDACLCNACAKKTGDEDMLLPLVNSPRVGVCGYTGRD